MELVLLEIGSNEWLLMWEWLGSHPINKDIEHPTIAQNGTESWQYMGSYKQGDRVVSELRHRNHPITNSIHKLTFKHDNFDISCIDKKFKL